MPRPRVQRAPPAPAAGVSADEEPISNPPAPATHEDLPLSRRNRDPSQEQIIRSLPNTLSREMKMAALDWRGGCFCCPANISFAQCMAGLWQASRKSTESAEALVHWGLNASKFLFEAGPKSAFGRKLMLQAGFTSLVLQLLPFGEEVPQSIALTPQMFFVQIFAIGGRQVPLSSTPQLVVLGLLALTTLSPISLQNALSAPTGPQLLTVLLRTLASSSDDRLRALTFQTLTEWINIFDGDPLVDDDDDDAEQLDGKEVKDATMTEDALIDALIDAGLAPAVVHVLESSSNAAVLRDACAFLLALLTGGVSGGVGTGHKGAAVSGHTGGASTAMTGGGGPQGHRPTRVVGMTAMELPKGATLEGRARCRARTELLKAGLVSALLSALSRRPSHLCYWVAINMGVSGARHLEMQWLMLVIARMCVLPPGLPTPGLAAAAADSGSAGQPASAEPEAASAAPSDGASPRKGGQPSGLVVKQRGRAKNGAPDPVEAEVEAERLRLAAAEQLLKSPMLSPWLESVRSARTEESAERGEGEETSNSGSVATESAAPSEAATAEDVTREGTGEDATSSPQTGSAKAALLADARAVNLLSRAIAASTLRSCVLPDATPLDALAPKDRKATPDFRALQRDRIRKATEEARAAQALASANSAVDVLSKAMASL